MPRHAIAVVLFLAVGSLAVLVGTSHAKDPPRSCCKADCEEHRLLQPIEGRFKLHEAKGNDVTVIDTVTGAVYRTEDKSVTTIDIVGGRVITRSLDVVDQRGGTVIRQR